MEVWKDISGYEGRYQVSNLGNVRSLDRLVASKNGSFASRKGQTLIQNKRRSGYLCVNLCTHGRSRVVETQRLVALAFIPNPEQLPCVNHVDEDKTNNAVTNLEWCTQAYNVKYGTRTLRARQSMINGKLSKPVVQCDLDGNVIAEFPSFAEVRRKLGFDPAKVNACALNRPHRKTAYGYRWHYKNCDSHLCVGKG